MLKYQPNSSKYSVYAHTIVQLQLKGMPLVLQIFGHKSHQSIVQIIFDLKMVLDKIQRLNQVITIRRK